MAQLKLMKKEWFDWFKNTTLDNITAWTEYYYINPDSQHWISNYQIWNEEWEQGRLDSNGQPETVVDSIRSKNFNRCMPNTSYYGYIPTTYDSVYALRIFFYDKEQNYISSSYSIRNGNVVSPSNAYYFKICTNNYANTYNHDICINVSNPTFNGKYEPYIIKIEDIIGVVKMNDLTWTYNDSGAIKFFTADISDVMPYPYTNPRIYSNNYITDPRVVADSADKSIRYYGSSYQRILVKDSNVTSVDELLSLNEDTYIIYIKNNSPL